MIKKYDKKETYCRMLGHVLSFQYCRTMQEGVPCGRILDCWFKVLPIQKFIQENYSEEKQKLIFEPPKPKMISLVDILEKARKVKDKNQDES